MSYMYIHTPLIYQQEVEMSACACFDFFRKTIHQKLHELYLETCQNQDDSKVCLWNVQMHADFHFKIHEKFKVRPVIMETLA